MELRAPGEAAPVPEEASGDGAQALRISDARAPRSTAHEVRLRVLTALRVVVSRIVPPVVACPTSESTLFLAGVKCLAKVGSICATHKKGAVGEKPVEHAE